MSDARAVMTLAVGNPVYHAMAVNLARSFKYWHTRNGACSPIRFVIATDLAIPLPADLAGIDVIRLEPGRYGVGFSPKLHLDRIAPAPRTLFVDADCLIVGVLDSVFDRFAGRAVSVVGGTIRSGEWFGDVCATCTRFGVPALPKFNGGIYYLEPGERCTQIYQTARGLEPDYDALGLVRLRGRPNDELLMAIAMASHDAWPIPEDGSIMGEFVNFRCGVILDVLRGRATMYNTPATQSYVPSWPLTEARPLIVHFLGYYTDRLPYTAEVRRLERVLARRWPPWAATLDAWVTTVAPGNASAALKRLLRPAYHALFGVRPVRTSSRVARES